jgi:hypothetical protein
MKNYMQPDNEQRAFYAHEPARERGIREIIIPGNEQYSVPALISTREAISNSYMRPDNEQDLVYPRVPVLERGGKDDFQPDNRQHSVFARIPTRERSIIDYVPADNAQHSVSTRIPTPGPGRARKEHIRPNNEQNVVPVPVPAREPVVNRAHSPLQSKRQSFKPKPKPKKTITPEELRQFRELMRQKYSLDLQIWRDKDVKSWDRPDVVANMNKADATMRMIQNTLDTWDDPDYFAQKEDYEKMQLIRQRIAKSKTRNWAKRPPWDRPEQPH